MSRGLARLAAHSGPPLAASQGNSRARPLCSPAASVTRAAHWSLPVVPPSLVSTGLWFSLLLVKGKHSKPSKETP